MISTRALLFPFYLLFVTGLLLPADGAHGLFTPKSLAFLSASLCLFMVVLIKKKILPSFLLLGALLSAFLAFLNIWLFIGIEDPITRPSAAFDQAKLFLITLSIPLMTTYLYLERMIDLRFLLRLVIFSNFTYCALKLSLIFFHLTGVINMWTILFKTGIQLQSMSIFGGLERLQTSVDISTPFIFMFALFAGTLGLGIRPSIRNLYLIAATLSNLFTFSRFLLFIQAAAFCLYLFSLNARQFLKALGIAFSFLLLGAALIGPQNIYHSVEQRFFSKANTLSDQTRVVQIDALLDRYISSPYIGAGLGAHAPKVVRDPKKPHSYEVQWAAFLMQFGFIGLFFILSLLFIIAIPLLQPPLTRSAFAFFLLYALWILSGFTNPFLISLQSGILYSLFLTAGWQLKSRMKIIS